MLANLHPYSLHPHGTEINTVIIIISFCRGLEAKICFWVFFTVTIYVFVLIHSTINVLVLLIC